MAIPKRSARHDLGRMIHVHITAELEANETGPHEV